MASTRAGAQCFERPILKLLDRAFGPAEFLRDVSNTSLLNEALNNHGALILGKALDELNQCRAAFDFFPMRLVEIVVGNGVGPLSRYFLPSIGHRILGDAK